MLALALLLLSSGADAGAVADPCQECGNTFGFSAIILSGAVPQIEPPPVPCRSLQELTNDYYNCTAAYGCPDADSTCETLLENLNPAVGCNESVPAICVAETALRPLIEYDDGTCEGIEAVRLLKTNEMISCVNSLFVSAADTPPATPLDVILDPSNETCASVDSLHLAILACLGEHQPSCVFAYRDNGCGNLQLLDNELLNIAGNLRSVCPTFSCDLSAAPTASPSEAPTPQTCDEEALEALADCASVALGGVEIEDYIRGITENSCADASALGSAIVSCVASAVPFCADQVQALCEDGLEDDITPVCPEFDCGDIDKALGGSPSASSLSESPVSLLVTNVAMLFAVQ